MTPRPTCGTRSAWAGCSTSSTWRRWTRRSSAQDGYWGLTQVTAHDEMLLLELLTRPNSVLTAASRAYQLGLMARVISSQRWGTPAGAPGGVTVHVKNGWLPDGTRLAHQQHRRVHRGEQELPDRGADR